MTDPALLPWAVQPGVANVSVANATWVQVAKPDPMRVWLMICGNGVNIIFVDTRNTGAAGSGMPIPTALGFLQFRAQDDGLLPTLGWFVFQSSGGTVNIPVLSQSLSKWPDDSHVSQLLRTNDANANARRTGRVRRAKLYSNSWGQWQAPQSNSLTNIQRPGLG